MNYIFFLLIFILPLNANAFDYGGELEQGGYLYGNTVSNAVVSLGKYSVTTDDDGFFIIGIPRLQKENSNIKITLLQGIEENHPVKIKQNDYDTQYIKGIKKSYVTPKSKDILTRIKNDKTAINKARNNFLKHKFINESFIYPVKGKITGVYGSRRFYNGKERNWHKGVDFAAPRGSLIKAPSSGIVRLALENSFFNGNLVIVDHGYNFMTIYAHMDSIKVKVGQKLKQGDIIGTLGSTGRSTGPHLHFGLYWKNMALNPMLILNKKIKGK